MLICLLIFIILCLIVYIVRTNVNYNKLLQSHHKLIHDLANNISVLDSSYEMSFGEFAETEFSEDINKRKITIESSIKQIYDLIKKG